MRSARRGTAKLGVVALAASFAVFLPGLTPLTAAAQDAPSGDESAEAWAPKGDIGQPPTDEGKPDEEYKPVVDCISSASTDGHVPEAELLKEGPWAQRHLRIREVQRFLREKYDGVGVKADGTPFRVAVIDTGVTKAPAFEDRLSGGGDYVMGGDGLEDCDGHGTQVAGIIAANPEPGNEDNPTIGFTGVAPDAEIISIRQSSQNYAKKTAEDLAKDAAAEKAKKEAAKAEAEAEREAAESQAKLDKLEEDLARERADDDDDDKGSTGSSQANPDEPRAQNNLGGAGNLNTLAQAIRRAVDEHNVDVINMSVDACRPNNGTYRPSEDESKVRAAIKYAADKNVVVVAAAGNAGGGCVQNDLPNQEGNMPDPNSPPTIVTPPWFSADGTMLAVGAIERNGGVADFSMRGPWVSVAAPGTEIMSLDPAGTERIVNVTFDGENKDGDRLQGTSFASPYVAGLAVLVKQNHPTLKARKVIERIELTAQHPGSAGGRDQFVGHGVIDPMAAVTARLPGELGIQPAKDEQLGSDMPPPQPDNDTPMIVALAGTAGGLVALAITLFAVRTVRRKPQGAASA